MQNKSESIMLKMNDTEIEKVKIPARSNRQWIEF